MATPQEAAKQAEQQQQIVEEDEFEEFEAEGEAGMRRALRLGLRTHARRAATPAS